MRRLRVFLRRVISEPRSWFRAITERGRIESEMEAELALHVEGLAADLVRAGCSPKEAVRRARIELGSSVVHKDEMRASLGLRWWDGLLADLRYALRTLRRSLGFTSMAVLSLGLAIGANATIFSVAKQLLYERLAVPRAAELRLFAWTANDKKGAVHSIWGDYAVLPDGRATSTAFSYPVFEQLRKENRVLQDLFAYCLLGGNATIHGSAHQVMGAMVSGNYYADLEVQPILGRGITPEDDAKPGQGAVVVISYGLWQREFGKSPSVLGQVIRVNGIPLTIVGVNPREFTSANDVQTAGDVFVPLSMQPVIRPMPGLVQPLFDQDLWWVIVMGRAKPGVSDATAQAALDTQLAAAVRATMTVKKDEDVPRMDLRDGSRGLFTQQRTFAKPMAVLMTLVGLVLLLACANIANLMLARGTQRQREVSVRLALGAGRARILRQMLVESLTLAAMGGVLGLIIAYFGRDALPRMIENSWERVRIHVHFDWGVFGFTSAVTMLTGILFGLAPASGGCAIRRQSRAERKHQDNLAKAKGTGRRGAGGTSDCAVYAAGDRGGTVSAHAGRVERCECGISHRPSFAGRGGPVADAVSAGQRCGIAPKAGGGICRGARRAGSGTGGDCLYIELHVAEGIRAGREGPGRPGSIGALQRCREQFLPDDGHSHCGRARLRLAGYGDIGQGCRHQ